MLFYGTAQLQSNVCMHPRHVLHVFQTCLARVSDASHTRSGCVPIWQKRGVALTYVLLQLYRKLLHLHRCISCTFRTRPAHVSNASCTRFRCILLPFQTRADFTLELSCTVHGTSYTLIYWACIYI